MSALSQITLDNECHSQQPKRIPRAPNAFFLYRSDFLKRGLIPPEVEKRQQNLSRIAGQCWKMLPDTEKAIWYGKAAALRTEYYFRHSSSNTGPSRKDKNRPSAKDKRRGNASNPQRSLDCFGSSQIQPPCHDNVFSAFSSSPSQISLVSLPPASKSSLSTTISHSPFPLKSPPIQNPGDLSGETGSPHEPYPALRQHEGVWQLMDLSSVSKNSGCSIVCQFVSSP